VIQTGTAVDLDAITPLILTFNEAPNICDTLERLKWAQRVVIVDSHSCDGTVEIAERFENVDVIQRQFDCHTSQWNFGLGQVATDWVLSLDADYRCPPELADEIRSLDDDCDAYVASFSYCLEGNPLRGSLYPPRVVLFRPGVCHYIQDGHTQVLVHDKSRTRYLRTSLLHDDRKPLSRWFASQIEYCQLEAEKLRETPDSRFSWTDRLRCWIVFVPLLTIVYCLFVKRLILDGRAGLYYTMQRVFTELVLSMMLLERRLRSATVCQGRLQRGGPAIAGRCPANIAPKTAQNQAVADGSGSMTIDQLPSHESSRTSSSNDCTTSVLPQATARSAAC
jgi:glycosyltransferase involved in cell wall biosynthesis